MDLDFSDVFESPQRRSRAMRDHRVVAGPQKRSEESLVQRGLDVGVTVHPGQYRDPLT